MELNINIFSYLKMYITDYNRKQKYKSALVSIFRFSLYPFFGRWGIKIVNSPPINRLKHKLLGEEN